MKRAVLLLLLLSTSAIAQVGTWHTYTDMQNVRDIVIGPDGLWAATSGGVFYESGELFTRYTNVDGLSAVDYTAVARGTDGLLVAGSSTGMVNVREASGAWFEVSDIARATEYPSRGITTIAMREGLAYIGTEFGVAVFDPDRREFGDTWLKFGALRAQIPVLAMHFAGDRLWVATGEGVASGDLSSINLKDPASWTTYTGTGSEDFGEIAAMASVGGQPLIATQSKLYRFSGTAWEEFVGVLPGGQVRSLYSSGDVAMLVTQYGLYRVGADAIVTQIGERVDTPTYPVGTVLSDVAVDAEGNVILASNRGVARWTESQPWDFRKPNGPNSNFIQSMVVDPSSGLLWVASGTSAGGSGVYQFDGARWTNLTVSTTPDLLTNAITDVVPAGSGALWLATWGGGVLNYSPGGTFEAYNNSNVPGFPGVPENTDFAAVRTLRMDSRGNLWMLHYNAPTSLLGVRTAEGNWHFISDPTIPTELEVVMFTIDQFDQKWIVVDDPDFRGILILNDNRTPSQFSDDTWIRLRASDANVLNADADVTTVTVDLLGDVWIGTDRGLRTVFNPSEPDRVSKTCFNTRCNIEGQYITTIAIDPVNNKWIGTKEGVFVLSADGSEIIAQYDVENSPLLDNEIQAITIHPETGVAYIATRRGLSSLVTPYVQPVTTFEDLVVSPNPFRPGIDERVMIDGLVEGAVIKILSVSGNLVAEIASPGGRVGFWDGRTTEGEYAASGVYFVVAAAPNGSQAATAKLAVVRP
jgi:ligand-binding sensor domain-containing protein